MTAKARDIMSTDPACCTPDDSIELAARTMATRDCGCLPVVEDMETRRVLGVVTDRDLATRALAEGRGPETSVRDVMSADPTCCGLDTDLEEVERAMAERQVRRVPITDDDGFCVGMIAQADLARRNDSVDDGDLRRTIERISEPTAGARVENGGGMR